MSLKQPDNLSKLLAAIAIFGINCTPVYAATLATSNPSPQPAKQLLAQQVTCTVTNLRSVDTPRPKGTGILRSPSQLALTGDVQSE